MIAMKEGIPFLIGEVFENDAQQKSAVVTFTMAHPTATVYQYIHRSGEVTALSYGEYLTVEPVLNDECAQVFPLGTILILEIYEARGTFTRCYILEDDGQVYRVRHLSQYEIDTYMAGLVNAKSLVEGA